MRHIRRHVPTPHCKWCACFTGIHDVENFRCNDMYFSLHRRNNMAWTQQFNMFSGCVRVMTDDVSWLHHALISSCESKCWSHLAKRDILRCHVAYGMFVASCMLKPRLNRCIISCCISTTKKVCITSTWNTQSNAVTVLQTCPGRLRYNAKDAVFLKFSNSQQKSITRFL